MTTALAKPGDMLDLHPSTISLDTKQLSVLVKTQDVEIIQLVVPKGSSIPTYEAEGEIILHCVEGRISLAVLGEPHELRAGQLLYLALNEPFSIEGLEHASVLATIISPKQGANVELIGGQKPR
jgi:quercetin dioxygenase-like cupin family protein